MNNSSLWIFPLLSRLLHNALAGFFQSQYFPYRDILFEKRQDRNNLWIEIELSVDFVTDFNQPSVSF